MLVVTANWAIPDGSVAALPRAALHARLIDDIRRTAVRAGMRHDGRYRPIERLVVVLAGDTIDGLVSGRWTGDVRPWERGRRVTARHEEVFRAAARHAGRPLAALTRLARRGVVVPATDRRGRPVVGARIVVPVHLVILAGDRDAAFERLHGRAWSERRGIGIGSVWNGEGFAVTHGAACDPLTAGGDRPTLLESLAVDLLARFGATLAERAGVADAGRRIVRNLADGQPFDMPLRLSAALRAITQEGSDADWITAAWHRSVDRWDRAARRAGCGNGHDEVAAIASWMHALGDGAATRTAARTVVAALAASLPAAASRQRGHRLTVLGHPATSIDTAGGHVVCLGAPSMRPCAERAVHGPVTGGVSCIETAPVVWPTRFPAVAIPEADEGGGHGAAWWPLWDVDAPRAGRSEREPILEAA
ncbi:MAG: hypothetical protein WCR51_07355 [Planctomycetia bacterium]